MIHLKVLFPLLALGIAIQRLAFNLRIVLT
jgi:hypothetical protein